jgi:hypothetical protein
MVMNADLEWKDTGMQKWMKGASMEAGLCGWLRLFLFGYEPCGSGKKM